jgi:hypothetical protein
MIVDEARDCLMSMLTNVDHILSVLLLQNCNLQVADEMRVNCVSNNYRWRILLAIDPLGGLAEMCKMCY